MAVWKFRWHLPTCPVGCPFASGGFEVSKIFGGSHWRWKLVANGGSKERKYVPNVSRLTEIPKS